MANTKSIHSHKSGTQILANGNAPHSNASETDTTGTLNSANADALTKTAQQTTTGLLLAAVANAITPIVMTVMIPKLGMKTAAAAVIALKFLAWTPNSSTHLFANANASLLAVTQTTY